MKEELGNKTTSNMTLKIKGGAIPRITLSRRSTVLVAIRVMVLIGSLCSIYALSWADGIHTGNYALIGWNDLGMHCISPSYKEMAILPPFNNLWVQVIQRGDPPSIITDGISLEYSIDRNKTVEGKTDFWQYAPELFDVNLPLGIGLTGNGLSGRMKVVGDHFEATGIPVLPYDDKMNWNPYQIATVKLKSAFGRVLKKAQVVLPVSNELNCQKCHDTGDPDRSSIGGAPTTQPGFGPNTRTLLQFRVVPLVGKPDPKSMSSLEKAALRGSRGPLKAIPLLKKRQAKVIRGLTLNEDFDDFGRLIQRLGTNVQTGFNNQGLPTWSRNYMDPATEDPHKGNIEVWQIFNLTGDTHPIHFHLVNVQILSRQPFDVEHYNGTPAFTGPARPPDPNEMGWKETVRMNPEEMTEVIMKFDLPKVPFAVPESPTTGGHEYVWHCHILEHEEHDMMRPLVVT